MGFGNYKSNIIFQFLKAKKKFYRDKKRVQHFQKLIQDFVYFPWFERSTSTLNIILRWKNYLVCNAKEVTN